MSAELTPALLSPPQRRVYEAISRIGSDGWPVTVREIMAETGHASTSTIHEHLRRLERSGLVTYNPRSPKGGWRTTESGGKAA